MTGKASGVAFSTAKGIHEELYGPLGISGAAILKSTTTTVILSGNIGINAEGKKPADWLEEIELLFANAEVSLKDAGCINGWKDVYQITSYSSAPAMASEEFMGKLLATKDRYLGTVKPVWTGVAVASLWEGYNLEMTLNAVRTRE